MRGTLLFVHGTGVRQEGFDMTWQAIRDGAERNGISGISFVGCPWGPKFRASFDDISDVLPQEVSTRDAIASLVPTEAALIAANWALLVEDPLFELRLAASEIPADSPPVVGARRPDQAVQDMLDGLQDSDLNLDGTGLELSEVARAAETIKSAPELKGAAGALRPADPELIEAIARAVVASVLATHEQDPPGTSPVIALNGPVRDALVDQIEEALAPPATRIAGVNWLRRKATKFASRKATALMLGRREGLTGTSLPAIADILFYQQRGDEIRRFVAEELRDLDRPTVAVGHSLGGVVLVDLLSKENRTVDLLVTVGSQAPLFFAIDALEHLRPNHASPRPFTPWLNIYNPYDFLSFCAKRIFKDLPEIWDEAVDPGVGFPASHSSYWHDDATYELIQSHWPQG